LKTLQVKLDVKLYTKFKVRIATQNATVQDTLHALVSEYVRKRVVTSKV